MKTRRAKKATEQDDGAEASEARKPRKRPCTYREGEEKGRDEGAFAWLDPDASSLECGICFMPFEAEVFMCNNGHAACAKCCALINQQCWVCTESTGFIRCRPLERVLAEISTFCRFSDYGCQEIVKYVERRKHEESCRCEPVACPVGDCGYLGAGTGLHGHVLDEHLGEVSYVSYLQTTTVTVLKSAPFCLLLTRSRTATARKVFLLLNGGNILAGRSLSLVCLGPRPEGDAVAGVKYKMEVRSMDGSVQSLAATAPCVGNLEGFEANKFIFVPDADWDWESSRSISVSIRIG